MSKQRGVASHTPGPWRIGVNSVMNGVQILKDYDGVRQYSVPICSMPPTGRGRLANARLIAAAPDMLDALVEARNELSRIAINQQGISEEDLTDIAQPDITVICRADFAIAKAKGE